MSVKRFIHAAGALTAGAAPGEATEKQRAKKARDWQDEAYQFVREHEELLEDEELDFITIAGLLDDSSRLLLEISNEIKAAGRRKGFPPKKMRRMMKGYDKLKEFCDRAFAIHEEKFGSPGGSEEEDLQGSVEERKIEELEKELREAGNNVIDARERFAM